MTATQTVAPPTSSQPSVQSRWGPVFVTTSFGFMLFGVFTAQVYFYWYAYKNDRRLLRIFVIALWILEASHTFFCFHFLYEYFVANIGSPKQFSVIVWSDPSSVLTEARSHHRNIPSRFYILRLWRLSGRNYVAVGTLSILLLARLGAGFATNIWFAMCTTFAKLGTKHIVHIVLDVAQTLSAIVDLLITTMMIFYLKKGMNLSSFKQSRSVIQTLMFFTINTGALSMIGSVCTLFLLNFMTGSLAFWGLIQLQGKLYANSVLGFLNARQHLRDKLIEVEFNSVPLHLPEASPSGSSANGPVFKQYAGDTSLGTSVGQDSVISQPHADQPTPRT
ncbi:uncharacterized protein PHACADRAFT_206227 [Phanerochaete carnosa HHB-10118-sp]|uniref:DUF6534 domain-containing protein n=1 Tax=Phanerochaete carnosa (strain HHB-10118-sp) TaxID=650164 RepID=K5W7U4_PHACS|nr:uncharacterized protein PHACADRAFT_206227 [Phanerochaete carnosa HHB-10118-sp]EKM60018.1 hypothetical protein PHACADRAFT_206227 [Phanerochaete carnosa HHB-10118-sp]